VQQVHLVKEFKKLLSLATHSNVLKVYLRYFKGQKIESKSIVDTRLRASMDRRLSNFFILILFFSGV